MKKANIWMILLIILGIITSCDIENLADKEINTPVSHNFTVVVHGQKKFGKTEIVSIDKGDVKEYLDKIKNVKIQKMTYQITNFSGNPNCTINSFKAYLGGEQVLNEVNVNPKEFSDNKTVFEVKNTEALNKASTKLQNNKSINVVYDGSVTSTESMAQFQIKVYMSIVVVANPLK